MAYGVTDKGWLSKPFQVIVEEIAANLSEKTGKPIPTTPDSLIGSVINIFAAEIKDDYDLGQAITDQVRLSKASGVYLDYIAEGVGLRRLPNSGSVGDLVFYGEQGAVVPAFFPVADELKRNVLTQTELTLKRTECYTSEFKVGTLQASTDYVITVEGANYTYTTDLDPTEQEILDGLSLLINTGSGYTSEVVGDSLIVTLELPSNNLTTTNSSNLFLSRLGSIVQGEAATVGALTFPENSITTLVGVAIGIDSVTNPRVFTLGRLIESDEELRIRIAQKGENTGTATKPAIEASLRNLQGVTGALLVENETIVDANGIPAKGFIVYVSGGDEQEIAETIFNTIATTISTGGDITRIVVDNNGDEKAVSFSRKPDVYAWMEITYSINSEEDFPVGGEDLMRQAVIDFGGTMYDGEDYINTKFYQPLYSDVKGAVFTQIRIATTSTEGGTPTYGTAPISVSEVQNLNFSADRIVINAV